MELPGVNRFTMFGCWNDGVCMAGDPHLNGMSSVFNSLMVSEFDPALYIVAGDNYYPTTVRKAGVKTKILDIGALESGFQCLADLSARDGTPVYLLMGNHDLQAESDFGPEKECEIIREELGLTRGTAIDTSTMVLHSGDTVFIFLDTNLYEAKADDKYARCELVYRADMEALDGLSNKKIVERITGAVQDRIAGTLEEIVTRGTPILNVIIVGHHPILGTKRKEDKETGAIKPKTQRIDDQGARFVADCYQTFPGARYVYLCADIHQYQEGEVHIRGLERPIRQYIVGTGGADLDELLPERDTVIRNGILTYSYEGGIVTNGYLNVHRDPGMEYAFDFVPTRPVSSHSSPRELGEAVMPSATLVPGRVALSPRVAAQPQGEGAMRRRKSRKRPGPRRKTKPRGRYSRRREERRRRRGSRRPRV